MPGPNISIIVRTYNEEKWITPCLKAIFEQTYKDFEVIIVDNNSSDKTVEKAQQFPVVVERIDKYLPGASINVGVKAAKGKYIALISAHCVPKDKHWLQNLLNGFDSEKVAGVYGRQEPLSCTPDTDKRDLMVVFGLDKKVQWKDSFFHNANSMVRADVLEKIPFDDYTTNIEDRIWAKEVLSNGYCVVYEPSASVYHYHGIHQSQNKERCRNVVKILERLESVDGRCFHNLPIEDLEIVALIPVRGSCLNLSGKSLLEYTIKHAQKSSFIKKVIVATDSEEVANLAKSLGADVPFLRDPSLSEDYIDLEKVYENFLSRLGENSYYPDIVVMLEVTFPFRSVSTIDNMIERCVNEGFDSVVAARAEYSPCFLLNDNTYSKIGDGFLPRKYKDPIYVTHKGVCCVSEPSILRNGSLLGANVGIYELNDPLESIEVRSDMDVSIASNLVGLLHVKES